MSRQFKYQSYLDKYKKCPQDCDEKQLKAFRWVHEEPTENDFKPINAHPLIAPRKFDTDEGNCLSYAISLYKDLTSSITAYFKGYNRPNIKPASREKFINDKGSFSAEIYINKEDGVCDEPNVETGHISCFEYEGCNLLTQIIDKYDNFVYNEAIGEI